MGMGSSSYDGFREMEVSNQYHIARFAVSIILDNTDVHFTSLSNHGLCKDTILS